MQQRSAMEFKIFAEWQFLQQYFFTLFSRLSSLSHAPFMAQKLFLCLFNNIQYKNLKSLALQTKA